MRQYKKLAVKITICHFLITSLDMNDSAIFNAIRHLLIVTQNTGDYRTSVFP